MKRLFFLMLCLSFLTVPLLGSEELHVSRGHNQIEIDGLQSIDISPVLEIPTVNSIDMTTQDDGEIVHVSKTPVLTLPDFTHAEVTVNEGATTLNLDLTKAGAKRIKEFTSQNVGRRLAFIVNGKLIKAPKVRDPINGRGLSIDPMDKTAADKLVHLINSRSK